MAGVFEEQESQLYCSLDNQTCEATALGAGLLPKGTHPTSWVIKQALRSVQLQLCWQWYQATAQLNLTFINLYTPPDSKKSPELTEKCNGFH